MKNNNIKKTLSIAAAVAATASFVTANNNVHADTVTNNQPATAAKDDSGIKPNQESTQAASSSATSTQATSSSATTTQAASSSATTTQAASSSVTTTQAASSSVTQPQATSSSAESTQAAQPQAASTQAAQPQAASTQTAQPQAASSSATTTQAASSSVTQAQVDEAQNDVNETQSQINQNQSQQDNVKQQISNADSQISNIQNDYNAKNNQINDSETKIVDNYQSQINNIQNNQVNDEKQNLNNQISDLNGQVETLQDQQTSSSQTDDNSKYTNVAGEVVTPSADTQKVLDKIDTNADYINNLYRNDLIGNTTGNSSARANGGHIVSDLYNVTEEPDSGDNYSLKAGHNDQLINGSKTFDDMYQNGVINNKLNDVDPIKNGQLTTDQERELAIIVANKLNNTREKLGLSRWVMTEKDFELAQRRASQRSAINLQHNLGDINDVFGGVYGENLALAFIHEGDNLNDVLNYIDASVLQLIDSDKGNDYDHRYNIFNQDGHIALGIKQVSNDTVMISMDWANTDVDNLDGTDLLALPAQLKAQGPTKKATTVVDNSAKIAQLKNQIADLQAKLANVQFDYDKLSSSDKKNYDNLKNEIEVTHTKANNARNSLKQNSQALIDQVAQTKTSLYNKLYDLQDQMKTLQDKLVLQKTKLVQLQEELKNSQKSDNKDDVAPVTPSTPAEGNKDDVAPVTPSTPAEGNKDDVAPVTPSTSAEGNKDDVAPVTPAKPSESNKDNVAPVAPETASEGNKDNVAPVAPSTPAEGNKDDVAPVTPVTPSEGNKDDVAPVTPVTPSEGNKDDVAPVTPSIPAEGNKDDVAPVTPVTPSEGNKDGVTPVTPETPSEGNKDNVAPVTPVTPSEGNKDNVAPVTPVTPAKPSDNKTNASSAVDTAKQAINQTKGKVDFSDKENVIALPDGSKLVNLYSSNGLVRYSATVLNDGTVRNIHEQLARKTNDGQTITVAQGQDGSQTVYVTDKKGNTQSVKFNNGNIVNYSRQATQPKSDLAQTGSSSNVSESAALVEVALIFIAGLTGLAGMKLMKMKENK